jgi:endoglucanase
VAAGLLALALALPATSSGRRRHGSAGGCATPNVNSPRDPANPLALPTAPSTGDPLQGAHFFVDGPRHGQAAGAIAQLIGVNPKAQPESMSWADFKQRHLGAINGNTKARAITKIADEQETQNISLYAEGGGPGAIFGQTSKLLCNNAAADTADGSVMVFSTFFWPQGNECPSAGQLRSWNGTFRRLVSEMARAIGNKRALVLEEIDGIGVSSCMKASALPLWLDDLKFESQKFGSLPHTVAYIEGGYSDANSAGLTARRLWRAGVRSVRGFWTNGTHFAWSANEIRWAQDVANDLKTISHGRYTAHFVVNSAQNGQGPKIPRSIVKSGNEELCNPPGRGLGRIPTGDVHPTFDGKNFQGLDGFLWTGVPGRSHNSNCPGGPWKPAGVFDPKFALELANNANQKLGPGAPSQPY